MAVCGARAGSWRNRQGPFVPTVRVMWVPLMRRTPALGCGQPRQASWGPERALHLPPSCHAVSGATKSSLAAQVTEQDLSNSKCFLEGDFYCHSHSDLLPPPLLLSCGLFQAGRTGRHGGGPRWGARGGGEGKGCLHPPLPPSLVLTLALVSPLRPWTPDKLYLSEARHLQGTWI